ILRGFDYSESLGFRAYVAIIRSEHGALGMAHSLASGTAAVLESSADAVAVQHADMPWIRPQTLQDLAGMANPQRIDMPM
ncbi:NTP transferase domain-containing protein, partial [Pseudomonas syringae group genomosp. 7]